MRSLSLGSCSLRAVPRIVAIIDSIIPLPQLLRLKAMGIDIFEIRADLFTGPFEQTLTYIRKVKETVGLPLIGTLRQTPQNKKMRIGMFSELIPLVDCIDIEIDTPINKDVIALARKKKIMISEHNYKKTPTEVGLQKIVSTSRTLGADIIKIATLANSQRDVIRLLSFCNAQKEPIVAISMGDLGTISRITAPLFGSLFSYGFIGSSVAPGQISAIALVNYFKRLYPHRQSTHT